MDKPPTPAGPNASQSAWPEDSGSEQDFGASGVFQVVKLPPSAEGSPANSGAAPGTLVSPADAIRPQTTLAAKPLEEPVVHKVVLGGSAAQSSPELLDRIRRSSAEKNQSTERPPAESVGKGSGGFTELLRTLESDFTSPAAAAKGAPTLEAQKAPPSSGFTSLLRTLNSDEQEPTPPTVPAPRTQPAPVLTPEEPRPAPVASSPGGFTELLRAAPGEDSSLGSTQMFRSVPVDAPGAGRAEVSPEPAESKPGSFTQLFGSLAGEEASAPSPGPSARELPRGSVGSFTQMLSLDPQAAPAEMPRYESKPVAGNTNYGVTPEMGGSGQAARTNRDPFEAVPFSSAPVSSAPFSPGPLQNTQPTQAASQAPGVGITRLIQMLDEPSSAPRKEEAPVNPLSGTGPGVWTQTFAALSTPDEPAAPVAKPLEFAPTQRPLTTPGAPAAASAPAGPSEFTRILDASRIRESIMRGDPAAPAENSVPAQQPQRSAPAMPSTPMPNYAAPPQPHVPSFPANYPPQAGSMQAPGGSMPHQPGMYAPPAPAMPSAPQAPQLKAVQPGGQAGMGKMQQYVPMLLVLIAVLLVVLLVTVIFLMKH